MLESPAETFGNPSHGECDEETPDRLKIGGEPRMSQVFRPLSGAKLCAFAARPGLLLVGIQRPARGRVLVKHLPLFFDLVGRQGGGRGRGAGGRPSGRLARWAGAAVRSGRYRTSGSTICSARRRSSLPPAILRAIRRPNGSPSRRRAGQRRRPSGSLRFHPAGDRRSRRGRGRDLDRRRFADLAATLRGRIEAVIPERSATWRGWRQTFRDPGQRPIVAARRRRTFWRRLIEGPAARLLPAGDDAGARRTALGELDAPADG